MTKTKFAKEFSTRKNAWARKTTPDSMVSGLMVSAIAIALPTTAMAQNAPLSPEAYPRLPYVVTPNATAAGTVPLATALSYEPSAQPLQPALPMLPSYNPVSLATTQAPYQGPVYSSSYLQGPLQQQTAVELPALPPIQFDPPEVEVPQFDDTPPKLPEVHNTYLAVKGMAQFSDPFSWNDANQGAAINSVNTQTDGGRALIVTVGKRINKLPVSGISAEAELSYRLSSATDGQTGKHRIYGGAINLVKNFAATQRFDFYAGVGVGASQIRHENISGAGLTNNLDHNTTAVMVNGFGGVTINLQDNLSLLLEGRRVYFPDVEKENTGLGISKSSYAVTEAGLGLKYGF